MNIYQLISGAIRDKHIDLPTEPIEEICSVTGEKTLCVLRKKLLSNSFTEQPKLQCPESNFVGIDVFQAFKFPKERKSSWLVTKNEFRLLKRIEVRPLVLSGAGSDLWAGWVTTSYKKHGAFRAKINTAGQAVWAFDEMLIDCLDIEKVNNLYNKLVVYLKKGFSRTTLETLTCPGFVIMRAGLKEWLDFGTWAKPIYKSNLYKFLCYLLPSQDELKADGWENPIKKKVIKKEKIKTAKPTKKVKENKQLSLF